jgi:uncharacterized protein
MNRSFQKSLIVCAVALIALGALPDHCRAQSPATFATHIDFDVKVSMRDGVLLSADIYRPDVPSGDVAEKFPVILTRTPYNKSTERGNHLQWGRFFASHGYVYVAMDVRGRGDSDGVFVPYRNEGPDGYDSIEWCAAQPWSSGRVGTVGSSYLGYDQWIAALEHPPHLTTMISIVTPPDPFVESPTGLQSPTYMSWYHLLLGHTLHNSAAVDWNAVYLHLPLNTMDRAAGFHAAYWQDILNHPGINDWWEPLIYQNKFDRLNLPVLHISGWYDDEQAGALMNYIGMTHHAATEQARKHQKLLMGAWPHAVNSTRRLGEIDFGPNALIDLETYELRWFDRWLKDTDSTLSNGYDKEAPVRIFIMGKDQWRDEADWPVPGTRYVKYFLSSGGKANALTGDGKLQTELPGEAMIPDHYLYNPADPFPFLMGVTYAQVGGPDDYREAESRKDVLVFTAEPFAEPRVICGPVRAHLSAASSAIDTDFMVKFLDVWPSGFAQRLTDGMVRARYRLGGDKPSLIEPGKIYEYDIDLWNTCQEFAKGHSVRIEVSSSAFPKYDRNQNTGGPLGKTANFKIADQTLYHDAAHPSFILLPFAPFD